MSFDPPLFSSLGPIVAEFVALKRALGRRFDNETRILANLDRFLFERRLVDRALTSEDFESWCLTQSHLSSTTRRGRMRVVRNLCLYIRREDPECFVPDRDSFPVPGPRLRPHIFSEGEIVRLLRVTSELEPRSISPLCGAVYRLAIVLLYTAGLRRGELARLVLSDYDPGEQTLLVRKSKFHKSRLVALSPDASREMDHYLEMRRRLHHDTRAPLLVSGYRGLRARSGASLGNGLRCLFRKANIRTCSGAHPRVHDLRHTYAVHALLRWYRSEADVHAKLPVLAASMGHVSVVSTAYYLAFLEPIVQSAGARFEHHFDAIMDNISDCGGDR